MIEVGQEAPDFTLKDQNNQEVTLSSFRQRKNVVVLFYPLTFTGVCNGELCEIRDDLPTFESDTVTTLAISVDTVFAHKVWAQQQGFEFPLLADFWPHGAVAKAYGVFSEERGFAHRATFIVDRQGIVRYAVDNGPAPLARDTAAYVTALAELS